MQPGNKLLLLLRSSQYLTPLSSPSFSATMAAFASARLNPLPLFFMLLILSLSSLFLPSPLPSPPLRSLFSVDIWLLFGDLKLRVPPTPSVRLMFDKAPLKCADFRGCLADGLVGLQRVQAGGLPSERDQLLPRHHDPLFPPLPPPPPPPTAPPPAPRPAAWHCQGHWA